MPELPPKGERPFSHKCEHGTRFNCSRCDFRDTIWISNPPKNAMLLLTDVAEMIAYWQEFILEDIHSFPGMNHVRFQIRGSKAVLQYAVKRDDS